MNNEGKTKKKIMVIEDEAAMLRVLCETFEREGFDVSSARNGESGFSHILAENPDIILLDIVLPRLDGLEMLRKLRKTNEYGKNVPVILLTNLNPDTDDINKAIIENKPAYYLVKTNWNTEDIVAKVRECLIKK